MDKKIDLKDTSLNFGDGSKEVRKFYKESKKDFLEENDFEEINSSRFTSEFSKDIQNFDPATYDVWVLHCPKSIDINSLANKRIKLPGRRNVDDIQVCATNYALPQTQPVGYVNKKGKYATKQLPLAGQIVVAKRLDKHQTNPDENTNQAPKSSGPQKFNAHVRHPFFGRDFKRYIELDKDVQKKLRSADKKYTKACIKERGTDNFCQIRNKLMATTQTLEQKEDIVRQSVLTGNTPSFMKEGEKPFYIDLVKEEEEEQQKKKKSSSKKHSKRSANGGIKTEGSDEDVIIVDKSPKKKSKNR